MPTGIFNASQNFTNYQLVRVLRRCAPQRKDVHVLRMDSIFANLIETEYTVGVVFAYACILSATPQSTS